MATYPVMTLFSALARANPQYIADNAENAVQVLAALASLIYTGYVEMAKKKKDPKGVAVTYGKIAELCNIHKGKLASIQDALQKLVINDADMAALVEGVKASVPRQSSRSGQVKAEPGSGFDGLFS